MSVRLVYVLLFTVCVAANVIKTPTSKVAADLRDRHMHYDPIREEVQPKQILETESSYWLNNAKQFVQNQLDKKMNKNVAKNMILFLGDGMSMGTLAATRMYMGGEEAVLSFEEFPHVGMSKTYCVNYQVPDSACTATAYLSGVKTNYGTIGVNAKVKRADCQMGMEAATHTTSIAKWAMDAGKAVGLVTTTRVTHASPAGMYAHTAERDWENNDEVEVSGCNHEAVDDIAEQMVYGEVGQRLKVIMGCGRREFLDNNMRDQENKKGKRTDGKNLIQEWLDLQIANETRNFIWNKEELMELDVANTDYLLGLFDHSHCQYNLDIVKDNVGHLEPTLSEMVDKAIDILSKQEDGFFLFVEGGRIDMAHHDGMAHYALDETVEFAEAVKLAREKLSETDTLIVTTADHSHTMTYAGYSARGGDIFGVAGTSDADHIPYMTLSYANGLGYDKHFNKTTGERIDPTLMNSSKIDFEFPATVPLDSETHGGDDVALFASGPWAHLFEGSFEQNVIPHLMGYAGCIGSGLKACDNL